MSTRRSCSQTDSAFTGRKVAAVQHAEQHVRDYKRIVFIKVDDHVGAALTAVRHDLPEARKELRNIDLVATCIPGHKICDHGRAGAVLDNNEVIAAAEEKIAGEGAAFAEDERVVAVA